MKDVHLFNVWGNTKFEHELNLLSVRYQYSQFNGLGQSEAKSIIKFEIDEDDPRWLAVKHLASECAVDFVTITKFSREDFANALWFWIFPTSSLGYPIPQNKWMEVTYDLNQPDYCPKCRTGWVQKAPFRLNTRQPRSETNSFFSPSWVHYEIFCRCEIQRALEQERITGLEYLYPRQGRRGPAFDTIVQWIVNAKLERSVWMTNQQSEFCSLCSREKINPPMRALYMQARAFDHAPDVAKTAEWFGTGAFAQKLVLVSRRIYELVVRQNWKGLEMRPVVLI